MSDDLSERTDQEIVDLANDLARQFYANMGYDVPEGYRFDQATHPHERQCWANACLAFELIEGTEVEEALANLADEED